MIQGEWVQPAQGTMGNSRCWTENESQKHINNYRNYFVNLPHSNYICAESPIGPLAVSLALYDASYMVIVRSRFGQESLQVPIEKFKNWWFLRKEPSLKAILKKLDCWLPWTDLKLCTDSTLPHSLLEMEEKLINTTPIATFVCVKRESEFNGFCNWILPKVDDKYQFQADMPEYINKRGIVVLFQTETNEGFLSIVKQNSDRAILIIQYEPEMNGYTLRLFSFQSMDVQIPAFVPKTDETRMYLLNLLSVIYRKSRPIAEIKAQRHEYLYNVTKRSLIKIIE
jgi:hypothetical protein